MEKAFQQRFLAEIYDGPKIDNSLYPFRFFNTDGNLIIFAKNFAILFGYTRHQILKSFSKIPGGDPRNYPSSSSAVLLPLSVVQEKAGVVEALIRGGSLKGLFFKDKNYSFDEALVSCTRINIPFFNTKWVMKLSSHRLMGDMILMSNDKVLIINSGTTTFRQNVRNII